jgi:hypothetical protein
MLVASFFAPRFDKWGCDYDELLQLLELSCARLGLPHVVISDAPRPRLPTFVCDLPQNLMQAILDGQRQLLAATVGPVLLVGADCLLTRDPRPYLAGDLVITIGPFADCEMNTGAIWCAEGPRCAPIWQEALESAPREWGEDQTALYAAIRRSGLDVRELRCEQHNWAPGSVEDPAGPPTVVHFRGRRKAWQAAWAARHLGIAV